MIIYLHGFRSSPLSFKAQMMEAWLKRPEVRAAFGGDGGDGKDRADKGDPDRCLHNEAGNRRTDLRFFSPQLPASPREAIDLVLSAYAPGPQDTLIGSSLGGYYATWLAEHCGCRCVLLNPAVHAARDLVGFVGEMKMFHSDDPFVFKAEYIEELQALEVAGITQPQRYFLVAAKGDELLDWREMIAKYPGAHTRLIDGSDHGLSDFANHVEPVLAFALNRPDPGV